MPTSSKPSAEQDLNHFADNLVASSGGDLKNPEYALETGYKPLSFVLKFRTEKLSLLSKENAEHDKAAYESNVKNTEAWQRRFCAEELKSIMRAHEIFLVSGHLIDASGDVQALAPCML